MSIVPIIASALLLAVTVPLGFVFIREVIRKRRSSLIEELHSNLLTSTTPISTLEFARNKYGAASGATQPHLIGSGALLVSALPFMAFSTAGVMLLLWPIGCLFENLTACAWSPAVPSLLWMDHPPGMTTGLEHIHTVGVAGFAFLGSYLFSVRYLLRATMNFELSPINWLRSALHLIMGVAIAIVVFRAVTGTQLLAIDAATSGTTATNDSGLGLWLAFAFFIGWIPDLGLFALVARLNLQLIKRIDADSLHNAKTIPIEILDGIDYETRHRLEESNITDVQNLATYNPILLFVETPYGLYQSFDWVLQAQLCVIVGPRRFELLKRHNIRTVFDLERAVRGPHATPKYIRFVGALLFDGASPHIVAELKHRSPRDNATLPASRSEPADGAVDETEQFDVDSIGHAVEVMLDDLHIHRLRQLWNVIGSQLGAEWLYGSGTRSHPPLQETTPDRRDLRLL